MFKKTKNNMYLYFWLYKLLFMFSFHYNPNAKRGKKSKYDEMLQIVHPIIVKEKLYNIDDEEHFEYKFAIEKALRFIEEVSKIDEAKKDYYDIYYKEYFKLDSFERFNIYETADKFYCSADKIKDTITDCNNLVHKFILCYKDSDIGQVNKSIVEKPYYTFVNDNINIEEITNKLKL